MDMPQLSEYRRKTYALTIEFGEALASELQEHGKFEEMQIVRDLVDMARQLGKVQSVH
jgi:hypothetical protein